MRKSALSINSRTNKEDLNLDFRQSPIVARALHAIRNGWLNPQCNEIAIYGTRGDGKTIGAFAGMVEHAKIHEKEGYDLPVPWIGVTDTFQSHKNKTLKSLQLPLWNGAWKITEQGHTATFWNERKPLVKIDLFGIEDENAMDRVRVETVGVWFEEPAPSAVLVQSSGISESAWLLALTSRAKSRIASHFYPAVLTANYPDEDHWCWLRFDPPSYPVFANPSQFAEVLKIAELDAPPEFHKFPNGVPIGMCYGQGESTQWFRVPCGERASHEDRMSWALALKKRPDLLRRLLLGQPGVILLGEQVAKNFREDRHVTNTQRPFMPGEPLFLGFDFGHTPTVVVGQRMFIQGFSVLYIKAALYLTGQGMKQLLDELLLPWLSRYAKWTLQDPSSYLFAGYDPAGEKGEEADIDNSALQTIKDSLDGIDLEKGPVNWEPRSEAMKEIFMRHDGVMIERNDYTKDLIRALSGRWHIAKTHTGELRSDKPKKPNHPWEDLGDSFIYCIIRSGMLPVEIGRGDKFKMESNLSH